MNLVLHQLKQTVLRLKLTSNVVPRCCRLILLMSDVFRIEKRVPGVGHSDVIGSLK